MGRKVTIKEKSCYNSIYTKYAKYEIAAVISIK